MLFFFSSRRRHTRWPRDWSSDVCSSDLTRTEPDGHARPADSADVRRHRDLIRGRAHPVVAVPRPGRPPHGIRTRADGNLARSVRCRAAHHKDDRSYALCSRMPTRRVRVDDRRWHADDILRRPDRRPLLRRLPARRIRWLRLLDDLRARADHLPVGTRAPPLLPAVLLSAARGAARGAAHPHAGPRPAAAGPSHVGWPWNGGRDRPLPRMRPDGCHPYVNAGAALRLTLLQRHAPTFSLTM